MDVSVFIGEEALREALERIAVQRTAIGAGDIAYGVLVRTQVAPDGMTAGESHVGEVGLQVVGVREADMGQLAGSVARGDLQA